MKKTIKFFDTLHRLSSMAQQLGDKHIYQDGKLTSVQFRILKDITDAGGAIDSMSQLHISHLCSAANMTGILSRLEKTGYIARSSHPDDKRKKIISITEFGSEKFKKVCEKLSYRVQEFQELLGPVDIEFITSQLEEIHTILHKHL